MTQKNIAPSRGRKIGYARVSTSRQTTDQQVHALKQAGCKLIFTDDGISATEKTRPGLNEARAALRAGDIFTVWAIDRAFRSTIEAIVFLDTLMQDGIQFQSLTQHIDTRTPEGRKWFIDTASWAEYERAIISRRTKEKMAESKRQGKHLGRPYKLNREKSLAAYKLYKTRGWALDAIASKFDVSSRTLHRAWCRYGLDNFRC